MENLTWEITDVQTDKDTAALDMVITNINMAKVLEIYENQLLENMLESPGLGLAQFAADMAELAAGKDTLISIIDDMTNDWDNGGLVSIRVTVSAYQDNGQWKIHLSQDSDQCLFGDMYTDTDHLEEKAAELEYELEKKWENWLNRRAGLTNLPPYNTIIIAYYNSYILQK